MPDGDRQEPELELTPEASGEPVPLEAHILMLRAELDRARQVKSVATAAMIAVAVLLLWQTIRAGKAPA